MFRLSHYVRELLEPTPVPVRRGITKPVVIWNLTRRCNLRCRHCYTVSADIDFPGELGREECLSVLDDLAGFGIPALILSGGEPLAHRSFLTIAERARGLVRYLALSTNGTAIHGEMADRIAAIGFDYVGISLDGVGARNDWFRGREGAFADALAGVRACKARGIRVGLRFTLTRDNAGDLAAILALCDAEGVDKFYLSHLVYAGRGDKHRGEDAGHALSRAAIDLLIDRAWIAAAENMPLEIVTGNNDADAVFLLHWAARHFPEERVAHLRAHLESWGGNGSGVGVANIDTQGHVHPDSYWSGYSLGSVRERPFSAIWTGEDPMLAGLRSRPRPLKGRCGACAYRAVCGGNTRIRALQLTGDPWAEDPACYLSDAEIGLAAPGPRLPVLPFRGKRHDPAPRYS
jgi:heme d1 biosynthesis radical SAM protein NirJ